MTATCYIQRTPEKHTQPQQKAETVNKSIPDDIKDKVIAAYKDGWKLAKIEQEFNVRRPTIYWILRQAGEEPARAQKQARLRGGTEDLIALYKIIESQESKIEQLETINAGLKAENLELRRQHRAEVNLTR